MEDTDGLRRGEVVETLSVAKARSGVSVFGGGTLGHPWGNAPGAVANRFALEACILARNSGVDLAQRGSEIIREACQFSLLVATQPLARE